MAVYGYQFEESQKKVAELWDESQKQAVESQKKLMNMWMGSLPVGTVQMNFSENVEKTLSVQRELINVALRTQKAATDLAVETQQQLWDSYFQTIQKMMVKMPEKQS